MGVSLSLVFSLMSIRRQVAGKDAPCVQWPERARGCPRAIMRRRPALLALAALLASVLTTSAGAEDDAAAGGLSDTSEAVAAAAADEHTLAETALAAEEVRLTDEERKTLFTAEGLERVQRVALEYKDAAQLAEALPLYKLALVVALKLYGSSNAATATCLNNLAGMQYVMGQYETSVELYRESAKVRLVMRSPPKRGRTCFRRLGRVISGFWSRADGIANFSSD